MAAAPYAGYYQHVPPSAPPLYPDVPPLYPQIDPNAGFPPPPTYTASLPPIFSKKAAVISSGATLAVAALSGMNAPGAVAISLVAGVLFGFLGAMEPTAHRIDTHVAPTLRLNWFGFQYQPGYTVSQFVVTNWTDYLIPFLKFVSILGQATQEAERRKKAEQQPPPVVNVQHIHVHPSSRRFGFFGNGA